MLRLCFVAELLIVMHPSCNCNWLLVEPAEPVHYCAYRCGCAGMDVVKAIEAVGSSQGKTSQPVVIADCGQLS